MATAKATSDKIQYACGMNPLDGWINTDLFDESFQGALENRSDKDSLNLSSVMNIDLLDTHPFPDNSFAFAYCEDFVEHLDQRESILFLVEALRTLKPGGVLRIATPGLDGVLAEHFVQPDRVKAYEESSSAFTNWGHKHFFCHESLKKMTESLGFTGYKKCKYGVSTHKALKGLETRDGQKHINLYAEMRKPEAA